MTITIPAYSALALNMWMVNLLESVTFVDFTILLRHFAACPKYYERFWVLGYDEYAEGVTNKEK